jgi:hypothetical protein
MFCPECNAEYREDFTRCSDCDVALVESLDRSTDLEDRSVEHKDPDYVAIRTVQPILQEQICSFLEANNIPTQVSAEAVGRVYGFTMDGLGAVSIKVPRKHADTASDLLERVERGELEIAEATE